MFAFCVFVHLDWDGKIGIYEGGILHDPNVCFKGSTTGCLCFRALIFNRFPPISSLLSGGDVYGMLRVEIWKKKSGCAHTQNLPETLREVRCTGFHPLTLRSLT
jgi:hypothetical protein